MDPNNPPVPAVAAAVAAGAAGAPLQHPITTGREYYDDAGCDDWTGRYAEALGVSSPPGSPLTPLLKREALTNAPDTTAAFPIVLQREVPNDPTSPARWIAISGCFRFRPPAGSPPTPHDGGMFGFIGDVRGENLNQLPPLIALPNGLFTRVLGMNNFRIPGPDNAVTLCAAAAQGELLGPFDANSPNTRLVALANTVITNIAAADLTDTLRRAIRYMGPGLGVMADEVSARSLRPSGAMALLCSQVDSNAIRLLGRWRSDEMYRYLSVQAQPIMRDFSARMITGGQYVLLPGPNVPPF